MPWFRQLAGSLVAMSVSLAFAQSAVEVDDAASADSEDEVDQLVRDLRQSTGETPTPERTSPTREVTSLDELLRLVRKDHVREELPEPVAPVPRASPRRQREDVGDESPRLSEKASASDDDAESLEDEAGQE